MVIKNKKIPLLFTIVGGTCLLFAVFPFAFYAYWFGNASISRDTAIWGHFSDFVNPFIALANLVAVLGLAYFVYETDSKRTKEASDLQLSLNKPILVFVKEKRGGGKHYFLKNIGNGAAINIVVKYKGADPKRKWRAMQCYSMKSGESLEVDWSIDEYQIIAVYNDINSAKSYVSKLSNNILSIDEIKGNDAQFQEYVDPAFEEERRFFWQT